MKSIIKYIVVMTALAGPLYPAPNSAGQYKDRNLVLEWDNALLQAERTSHLGPPMVARLFFVFHSCIYDAWAAYDDKSSGTIFDPRLKAAKSERTDENRRAAVAYAAYRAAVDLFPASRLTIFEPLLVEEGYVVPAGEQLPATARIANAACDAVLSFRHQDGANQLGDMTASGVPYADYTGYLAVNPVAAVPINPASVKDPARFQPLYYNSPTIRQTFSQSFVGAQWFKVKPFAGPYDKEIAKMSLEKPLAPFGSSRCREEVQELINISSNLSDEEKMISEYWNDGPNSELPPGHWILLAEFVSRRDQHRLEDDVKMFFVLANALFDTSVATWTAKHTFDSVRPITLVPYLFHGQQIHSWGGPFQGTVAMDGKSWKPYQLQHFPTPPFPEYPSGHSAFSAAAARILELWTGKPDFGASVIFPAGSSKIEPGVTPSKDTTLEWPTFAAAADQAGMSRRYGGIHFRSGDLAGRKLGRMVADKVWQKSSSLFSGSVSGSGTQEPLSKVLN